MSDKWLKLVVKDIKNKVEGSSIFTGIFSSDYVKDPLCILQLGTAILLDKPIALLVVNGTKVPEHIKKIAQHIEYLPDNHSKEQFEQATKRMLTKMTDFITTRIPLTPAPSNGEPQKKSR